MYALLLTLYVVAAVAEAAGVVLTFVEIRAARRDWQHVNRPHEADEGPAYGISRAQHGLQLLFVGSARRRVVAGVLLLGGVLVGAAGNIVSASS